MPTQQQSSVDFFKHNNFVRLSGIVPLEFTEIYSNYAFLKGRHFFSPDTTVSPKTHGVYGDTLMETLLLAYKGAVEEGVGLSLLPTYSYYRVYQSGEELPKQKMGPSNEITAVLCLGFNYGDEDESQYNWRLSLECPKEGERSHESLKTYRGNMVVFRGNILRHWRESYTKSPGSWYAEVYLNYITADGPYAGVCDFDGREGACVSPTDMDIGRVNAIEKLALGEEEKEVGQVGSPGFSFRKLQEKFHRKTSILPIDVSRLEINKDDDISFSLKYVGDCQYPILLADNVYKDPDYVRDLGLKLYYEKGGASTSLPMGEFWSFLFRSLAHLYGFTTESLQIFGRPFFRYFLEKMTEEKVLASNSILEGLTFLNLPEDCMGGMSFYRHKQFKIQEFIHDEKLVDLVLQIKEKKLMGKGGTTLDQRYANRMVSMGLFSRYYDLLERGDVSSYSEMGEGIMGEEHQKDWEVLETIEMKYNRFICYPGFLMKSLEPSEDWNKREIEARRLTQRFSVFWPKAMRGNHDFRY
jgi:hypothetical protein